MPLTFPSHAAAVLPFTRWRVLPPSALVVGSLTPDLAYLLDLRMNLHAWPHGMVPGLALGVAAWALLEVLVLPFLRRTLPVAFGIEWGRLAATRGWPASWRGLGAAVLAIALGALTHVAWDGFTHGNRWPASEYRQVVVLGERLPHLLQILSSAVGLGLVVWAVARAYPGWPEVRPTGRFPFRGLVVAMGVCAVLCGAVEHGPWGWFWGAVRGAVIALVGCALLERALSSPVDQFRCARRAQPRGEAPRFHEMEAASRSRDGGDTQER